MFRRKLTRDHLKNWQKSDSIHAECKDAIKSGMISFIGLPIAGTLLVHLENIDDQNRAATMQFCDDEFWAGSYTCFLDTQLPRMSSVTYYYTRGTLYLCRMSCLHCKLLSFL